MGPIENLAFIGFLLYFYFLLRKLNKVKLIVTFYSKSIDFDRFQAPCFQIGTYFIREFYIPFPNLVKSFYIFLSQVLYDIRLFLSTVPSIQIEEDMS